MDKRAYNKIWIISIMERISCKSCKGTGFLKKTKKTYCSNNIYKISSHLCCKCEHSNEGLSYKRCSGCYGDGYRVTKIPPIS